MMNFFFFFFNLHLVRPIPEEKPNLNTEIINSWEFFFLQKFRDPTQTPGERVKRYWEQREVYSVASLSVINIAGERMLIM